ncbi:MAG: trigger factor [Spirochaetes bacterium]|nr:trigger factor [Spirochaetota bacterium]
MELQIDVPVDVVESEYTSVLEKLQKMVKIDGFRKGKAPMGLVETRYIQQADKEVAENLVQRSFMDAVSEKQYTPIAQPHYSFERIKRGEAFTFKAVFETPPTVVLGKYREIAADERTVAIKDSDVDDEITALREREAKITKRESGAVKNGDYVKIKVKRLNDPSQDKGTPPAYKDYTIIVGKSKDASSLDKYIVGMTAGEERDIDVKYPKDYYIKDLAGERVTYSVRVEEISDFELPDLNDEFSQKHQFTSVAEMKTKMKENIEKYVTEKNRSDAKASILQAIIENSTFDIPESMVQTEMVLLFRKMQERIGYQIDSIDKFAQIFGIDKDEFLQKLRDEATQSIKTSLVLHEIAKEESLQVAPERTEEVITAIAQRNNKTVEEINQMMEQSNGRPRIENELLMDQSMDFIYDQAKVKKLKSIPYEEFMRGAS